MRSLLLATIALTSTVSNQQPADACGVMPPRVFLLSKHAVDDGMRTFALLHTAVPRSASLVWRQLAPWTYDNTTIADAPALGAPIKLTLLGPSGTRSVSSTKQAFLAAPWQFERPTGAIEVTSNDDGFSVAVAGQHAHLAWLDVVEQWTFAGGTRRVAAEHGLDASGVKLWAVAATDAEVVSGTDSQTYVERVLIRRDGVVTSSHLGTLIGAIESDGLSYVLVAHDGAVTPVRL